VSEQFNLTEYLEDNKMKLPKRPTKGQKDTNQSLWSGPEKDGITFSLLSRFIVCRERFRITVCEGLRPVSGWNHRLGYGNMWHVCEEALAQNPTLINGWCPFLENALLSYVKKECHQYPTDQQKIVHWYNVCRTQFPVYVRYWMQRQPGDTLQKSPHEVITSLFQERVFGVPYKLPSGRVVKLRGKWDRGYLDNNNHVWIQENKTKGDMDFHKIQRQLKFDLQTMIYLIAWKYDKSQGNGRLCPRGVLYNVVRRPLSGGKGSIVRHKATKNKREESLADYHKRLEAIIEGDPGYYFARWESIVTPTEIDTFQKRCLNPILEQLCDWWQYMNGEEPDNHYNQSPHWQHPFGVWNVLDEGGSSDLDEYIETGNTVGLERTDNLFPELS
jgi:hypothetical protein